MKSKTELNSLIATTLGFEPPPMSSGSTESKRLFVLVNETLGLGINNQLSKPEMARCIVEAAGFTWSPICESAGSTVTREGLNRVLVAINFFIG